MKPILFLLFSFLVIMFACDPNYEDLSFSQPVEVEKLAEGWSKIYCPINDNFKKVIFLDNKVVLLTGDSSTYYTCSPDFTNWQKNLLPFKTSYPTPVVFKGCLFLNSDNGILMYKNGWEKITDWPAYEIAANEERLLAIKNSGEWGNDTIMSFNEFSFSPDPRIIKVRDSINYEHGTTYTFGSNLYLVGDTILFEYVHRARSGQGIASYSSYDNGKNWQVDWNLFGGGSLLANFCYRNELGAVFATRNAYYKQMFRISSPAFSILEFGEFYCLFADEENLWFSARINEMEEYDKVSSSCKGIFSVNGETVELNATIRDIKKNRDRLVAVGDSGTVLIKTVI